MNRHLIIIGASARAAAQSVLRARGQTRVWGIDLFADRDLQTIAAGARCPEDQYPGGVIDILQDPEKWFGSPPPRWAPVLLTGAMELYPDVIEAIGQIRPLVGSQPDAVRCVRRRDALSSVDPIEGIRHCRTLSSHEAETADLAATSWGGYLIKRDHGPATDPIRSASPAQPLTPGWYLQQRIEGTPIAAVYAGRGHDTQLIGVTEQIIGDSGFGASGYTYAGSIGPMLLRDGQVQALAVLGQRLSVRDGLGGLFGVDAVLDHTGTIWPVEVNPRYTASIEILERAGHTPVFSLIDPSLRHKVRQTNRTTGLNRDVPKPIHGKAIVFARRNVVVPDLYRYFEPDQVADVPRVGECVVAGKPICTLFTTGSTRDDCLKSLRHRAAVLYERLVQEPPVEAVSR